MAGTDGTVDRETLTKLFDCTVRQISILAAEGIVVRAARGRFHLAQSIRNYVGHLRRQASGRRGDRPDVDAIVENALLRREQRRNYELKNAILEGTVVPTELIRPGWERIVRSGRMAVLAAPAKIRFRLPHLTAADQVVIEEILRDALEAAAIIDEPPAIDISSSLNDEERDVAGG